MLLKNTFIVNTFLRFDEFEIIHCNWHRHNTVISSYSNVSACYRYDTWALSHVTTAALLSRIQLTLRRILSTPCRLPFAPAPASGYLEKNDSTWQWQ